MSELPPGLVWKWKTRSCSSAASKQASAISRVASSQPSGFGLPPRRKVVFRATMPASPAWLKASRVISAFWGRNETHSPPWMRSLSLAASITSGFSENGCSWRGIP